MIRANYKDKKRIVDILTNSFDDNKSVNYIVKQDSKRIDRIRSLMDYSFEMCCMFGDIFLSEDRAGCALIVYPDKQKTNLKSILLNLKLVLNCIGLYNIRKTMSRESKIKKLHPKEPMLYLWFIGVTSESRNKGTGSSLMNDVIEHSRSKQRTIYLETSTLKNIPWYRKFGFTVYNKLDLGYELFFLKKE